MPKSGSAKVFLAELRAPFFTATIVPIFLGAAIAWNNQGTFSWSLFALTLLAGIFLHAGTNVANDYFDHKNKCDDINTEYVRPFTGGSRLIQLGLLSPRQVITYAGVLFSLGAAIGLYLVFRSGLPILWLGLIGLLSGFFYSAPPLKLVERGVGELIVGINFGVLEVLGAYYVQAGSFALEPAIASIPVALLIAAVLYINEFPDFNADRAVGKNHLVVRLGRRRGAYGYVAILIGAYGAVAAGALIGVISPFTLIVLLTVPLAVKSSRIALTAFDSSKGIAPANAATVLIHLLVGLLLTAGYILHHFVKVV